MTENEIEGQQIVELRTISSMYANNCISAIDDNGDWYKIKVNELIKLVNGNTFVKVKKIKHTYLVLKD